MRNGILGAVAALLACAGVSSAQFVPGGPVGGSSIIPPQIPGFQGPGADPGEGGGMQGYPPQGNWDQFNPSGPAGGEQGDVPRFWLTTEYLMWFAKSASYTSPTVTNSNLANRGIIGNSTTQIVSGLENVDFGLLSGYRISGGGWLDASGRYGFDITGFSTQNKSQSFVQSTTPNSNPLIARPFTNDVNNGQGSYVVAAQNFANGYVIDSTNTLNWGIGGNFLVNLFRSAPESNLGYSLIFLTGFRFLQNSEGADLLSSSTILPGNTITFNNQSITAANGTGLPVGRVLGPVAVGFQQTTTVTTVNLSILDQYQTRNSFYGSDLGLYQQFNMGRWSLGLTTKVALGGIHQAVDINGYSNLQSTSNSSTVTTVVRNGATIFSNTSNSQIINNNVVAGGVYAQTNSIGHFSRNVFTAIPEVNLRFGYTFTPAVTGFFGYNALYMNRVVRASDLVNGLVNPALSPTSPTFGNPTLIRQNNPFPESDYWLQGLTFGLNVRF